MSARVQFSSSPLWREVSRISATEDRLSVTAVFRMRNHGETATFETGFPIGRFRNFESFSIEIDVPNAFSML